MDTVYIWFSDAVSMLQLSPKQCPWWFCVRKLDPLSDVHVRFPALRQLSRAYWVIYSTFLLHWFGFYHARLCYRNISQCQSPEGIPMWVLFGKFVSSPHGHGLWPSNKNARRCKESCGLHVDSIAPMRRRHQKLGFQSLFPESKKRFLEMSWFLRCACLSDCPGDVSEIWNSAWALKGRYPHPAMQIQ